MNVFRIVGGLLLPLLLAGCGVNQSRQGVDDEQFKIAATEVIEARKEKLQAAARLGPVIAAPKQHSLNQQRRTFIGREEKRNYLQLQKNQDERPFNITLHLDGVEIHRAFALFAAVVGRNILVGDEVSGKVSAQLRDVPWSKALDALLKMKDLAKHVDHDANIIRIHQRAVLSSQEAYDRKRSEELKASLELAQSLEPLHTEIFQLHYADPGSIKAELESVLKATSGGKQTAITIDERTRTLVVQATKENLELVDKLIAKMDLRTEQVLIEAYIVEVTDRFSDEFGAYLKTQYGNNSTTISSTFSNLGSGAVVNLIHGSSVLDLELLLSAMEDDGITNIISNPRVFTLDNSMASISQGDQIPYKSTTSDGAQTTEFKDAKVSLDVTPSIVGDGNLLLELEVHKDSVEVDDIEPPITQRIIKTKLLVPDRSTVVIGGIYTHYNSEGTVRVPLLGDIPVVGALFKKQTDLEERKELLIFISPYII